MRALKIRRECGRFRAAGAERPVFGVERSLLNLAQTRMEAIMLKKILLALDGSENAERALWWVTQYAGREKAQVVLFRAVNTTILEPEFIPSKVQDAINYLLRMETEINQSGIPAKVVVRQGKPAETLV